MSEAEAMDAIRKAVVAWRTKEIVGAQALRLVGEALAFEEDRRVRDQVAERPVRPDAT